MSKERLENLSQERLMLIYDVLSKDSLSCVTVQVISTVKIDVVVASHELSVSTCYLILTCTELRISYESPSKCFRPIFETMIKVAILAGTSVT